MTTTEIERLAVLETKMAGVEEKLDGISKQLDAFIKCADQRYASKLTEKLVYGLAGTALLAVVYLILSHVGVRV